MSEHVDSKTLFVKQVQSHSQALCELLGCDTTAAAPPNIIERCAVATRMLAGTSSLMELDAWEQVLTAFEGLLVRYNETGMPWDERIAQFTSELIERQEKLVAGHAADPSVAITQVVPPEELSALREEAALLQESITAFAAQSPAPAVEPASPASPPGPPGPAAADDSGSGQDVPMRGVVGELESAFRMLTSELNSPAFGARDWMADSIAAMRSQLWYLNFYACSLEQMIERHNPAMAVNHCNLLPLKIVLGDFADVISESGETIMDIVLNGEETLIDPRLLPIAGDILHRMINDVFSRSEHNALGITIDVAEFRGAIRWRITDNGNNFISDSQLDHEDQLAFYPGLKSVRKTLGRYNGVLWVEPRPAEQVRFEFTLPVSKSSRAFMMWGAGDGCFAIRSVQICDLMPVAGAPRGEDTFGEFLTIGGMRVPLLALDVLYKEGPSGGDMVAVIGSLEKRVAFYVSGGGALAHGTVLEGVVPVWRGPDQGVALVDERRVALLDADLVLEGYLDVTGELNGAEVSGGVVDDESELSNSQATFGSDVSTPPDLNKRVEDDGGDVEVLVVEQSESLRGVLTEILSGQQIRAAFAGGVDEAIELIHARSPRVIISEFRMPTMAAKVLVDVLGREGKPIPVLVTTSQSGKTAALLVEKLGAAGYLSKPLDRSEVTNRVTGFLPERART